MSRGFVLIHFVHVHKSLTEKTNVALSLTQPSSVIVLTQMSVKTDRGGLRTIDYVDDFEINPISVV